MHYALFPIGAMTIVQMMYLKRQCLCTADCHGMTSLCRYPMALVIDTFSLIWQLTSHWGYGLKNMQSSDSCDQR